METQKICQSCGMPMKEEDFGTNAGGGAHQEYCKYCFQNGRFSCEGTMEEMIESCIPFMVDGASGFTAEQARELLQKTLPQLKRWKRDA